MELSIRKLEESDWDTLVDMWNGWDDWKGNNPTKDLLPENGTGGYIVEKNGKAVVAGFLYTTNSKACWIEWVVSDKKYRGKDRKQAITMLIQGTESVAKASGFSVVFSIGRNKGLIESFEDLGYNVDKNSSHEIIKAI